MRARGGKGMPRPLARAARLGGRRAPAWEKGERMAKLYGQARALALAELRRRLADLLLGPELAARVYGPQDRP